MATPILNFLMTGPIWDNFMAMAQKLNQCIDRLNLMGSNDDVTITGGDINNTTIGLGTPAAGRFTTLVVEDTTDLSNSNVLLLDGQLSANVISGGSATITQLSLTGDVTQANQATTKTYVDETNATLRNEMIAYSLIFGG